MASEVSSRPKPGMMGAYRAFLALPAARRLLLTSIVARLPRGMSSLAILLLVHQQTGSFASAGLVVGVFTLCGAVAAPVQGAWVDRYGGPRVLVPCAVAHSVALIALVIAVDANLATIWVAGLAGLGGALIPPVDAAARVLWPTIAPDATVLETAYQVDATSQEVIWTLGPLIVAAFVATASPSAAVFACAFIVTSGTLLFISAPLARRPPVSPHAPRTSALVSPGLKVLVGASVMIGVGIGALEVGFPALAIHSGSRAAAGVLLALWSIGSMIGGLVYGSRTWSSPREKRYPVLLAVIAVTIAPLMAASSIAVAIPLSVLAGVGLAPALGCEYSLVGALASRSTATEAFTWITASLVAGLAAGLVIAGPLVQTAGVWSSFAVAASASAIAAAVSWAGRSQIGARTPAAQRLAA